MNSHTQIDRTSVSQDPSVFSRRNFMKFSGGCGALSSTAVLSQLLNLQLTQSAAAQGSPDGDYKALVCVFLLGGMDSFNALIPRDQSEYDEYATIRSNLALDRESTLAISDPTTGRSFGLHPGLSEIQSLYNDGSAAIVANAGSLVFPTTKANYQSIQLPLGLFSHSDLIQHWQTSVPQSRSQVTGWGGRMADLLTSTTNGNPNIAMNVSLGGINMFQTGSDVVPYVVGPTGSTVLGGYGLSNGRDQIYTRVSDYLYPQSTDSGVGAVYSDLMRQTLANTKRVSIDAAEEFQTATANDAVTLFPNTNLGNSLRMIARTIRGRATLGHGRQIFYVAVPGWDHHDEVLNAQAGLLPMVSQALKAFYDETVEMGVEDSVTTFTASDFGRTLSSNGNGSDHAWGGNQFVIGGSVQGGQVYGQYPETLAAGNDLDVGRGRLIPTTSVDEYNAELAMWFGVSNGQLLEDILPNIRNFYSSGQSTGPLGLFG